MTSSPVSVTKILGNGWNRMVQTLFEPFDMKKWFILGFCAWLATLGGSFGNGPGGGNFPGNLAEKSSANGNGAVSFWNSLDYVLNGEDGWIFSRLIEEAGWDPNVVSIVVAVSVAAIVLIIALSIVVYWLHCRFSFMFLANLARDTQQISEVWTEFKRSANSYFKGTLLFYVIGTVVFLILFALAVLPFYDWLKESAAAHEFVALGGVRLSGLIGCSVIIVVLSIGWGFYTWFFNQLLVPIMYRDGLLFREGLARMNRFLCQRFWTLLFYWFLVNLTMFGLMLCVGIAGILTCCILFILIAVPYIGAVVLLPLSVFNRFLGIELLDALDPVPPPEPQEQA